MRILPSYRDIAVALSSRLRRAVVVLPLLRASAALFGWACAHRVGGRHAQTSSARLSGPRGSSSDAAEGVVARSACLLMSGPSSRGCRSAGFSGGTSRPAREAGGCMLRWPVSSPPMTVATGDISRLSMKFGAGVTRSLIPHRSLDLIQSLEYTYLYIFDYTTALTELVPGLSESPIHTTTLQTSPAALA
jgi:hypothetical protein